MRENIGLSRGKRIGTDEWVEGNLWIDPDLERTDISYFAYYYSENGLERDYCVETVDPDTVGECTGLRDKNGKLIFEGDIVKFCGIKGVINYSTGCYCVKTNKPDWRSRNNPAIDIVLNEYENELEIIGNIHDNPELLKEGADNG